MVNRPNVLIFQNFQVTPTAETPTLQGVIIGPQKEFLDILNDADDKSNAFVGNYDKDSDQTFLYPNLSAGAQVELDSVQVFADEAKLEYLKKNPGTDDYDFRTIFGHKNRIRTAGDNDSDELRFAEFTNSAGTTFLRSSEFVDRDVQPGDCVTVSATVGSSLVEHTTTIIDILSDDVPSVVSSATADSGNVGTQAQSIGATTPGVGNTGDDTFTFGGTYVGNKSQGILDDTYTIEILTGGTAPNISAVTPDGGNTGDDTVAAGGTYDSSISRSYVAEVTTGGGAGSAELTITDNNNESVTITVSAFGVALPFGDEGLNLTVTDGGDTVMTLGDKFAFSVTPSNATMSVTTSSGTDDIVSRIFPGFGVAFPIGNNGLEVTVTDGGDTVLTDGDTFEVDVVAAYDAVIPTISGDYEDVKDRTYTLEVTKGGDYSSAEITVTSNIIDSNSPQVVAVATAIEVGNFGIQATFAANTQNGLNLGEKWTVTATGEKKGAKKTLVLQKNLPASILDEPPTVGAAVVDAVAGDDTVSSGGSYEDSLEVLSTERQEIYTIEITTGGAPGTAEYTVTSSSGKDDQAAATVTAFGVAHAVGSKGVTITFTDGGDTVLTAGDRWKITVTKLNLGVSMSIRKLNLEIPRFREDSPTITAWDRTASDVTVKQNIQMSDASFNEGNTFLPLIAGKLYIGYDAIVQTNILSKISIQSDAEIESTYGRINLRNPIAYALSKALLNSNNTPVQGLAIRSDDKSGYSEALESIENSIDVYNLVPLTFDREVHALFESHVDAQSAPEVGKFRRALLSAELKTIDGLVETFLSSGVELDFLATINDFGTPGDFRFVEVDASTPVDFIALGIKPGDLFRTNYATDLDGNLVFDEFAITNVISDSTVRIANGVDSEVTVAQKFEIHRQLTKNEQAEQHAAYAASIGNRRVSLMYPDFIEAGDDLAEGFHIAAAVAGMEQGLPVHQPISNFQVLGFTNAPRSVPYFSNTQLDTLANGGVFILTQEVTGEIPFVRHQLTTDVTDVEVREHSIQRNVDAISILLKEVTKPFLGKFNLRQKFIGLLRTTIANALTPLLVEVNTTAGSQLISFDIVRVITDPVLIDKVCAELDITVPAPVNTIEITITV